MKIGFIRQGPEALYYLIPTELLEEFDNEMESIEFSEPDKIGTYERIENFLNKYSECKLTCSLYDLKVVY